ncbi:hypothetical protein ACTXT7_006994 [Hymenolepis weldensis]
MKKSVEEIMGGYVRADPIEVPTVMRTKFPPTVMIFSVVRSEGRIMTPSSFPQGFRVNADAYVETLQTIVFMPCIDSVKKEEDSPMSSNKIRPYSIKLSKPMIWWPRIFIIMSHQTYGPYLLTRP